MILAITRITERTAEPVTFEAAVRASLTWNDMDKPVLASWCGKPSKLTRLGGILYYWVIFLRNNSHVSCFPGVEIQVIFKRRIYRIIELYLSYLIIFWYHRPRVRAHARTHTHTNSCRFTENAPDHSHSVFSFLHYALNFEFYFKISKITVSIWGGDNWECRAGYSIQAMFWALSILNSPFDYIKNEGGDRRRTFHIRNHVTLTMTTIRNLFWKSCIS